MGKLEKDSFWKFECLNCELEEITEMLWYVYEDYYGIGTNDIYTKANSYDRLSTYLINIHSLLLSKQKEAKEFIESVYKENQTEKEISKNLEASNIETTIFYNKETDEVHRIPVYTSIKMIDGKIVYK